MSQIHDTIRAIRWADDHLLLLDQRRLPHTQVDVVCRSASEVAAAIRDMVVRGAPAIGITAAYGVVLAAQAQAVRVSVADLPAAIEPDLAQLAQARPTAVNLAWALERMRRCLQGESGDAVAALCAEAAAIHEEDIAANRRMGELGSALMEAPVGVLTHCNTGSLATGGYGTALGVIRSACAAGKVRQVYADETRPWLQGARLTAWELVQDGIPVQLIAEGAAAYLMQRGAVDWVVVGSDRIAANGDVANKIGTYGLAVLARHHGVRFMVVAPTSTVDLSVPDGQGIPIEIRSGEELLRLDGQPLAAAGAGAWNPVFDVTPASLVDAIVTERGVLREPNREKILAMMKSD